MQHSIPFSDSIAGDAIFSDCGQYRYSLQRVWAPAQNKVMMVGLNPSTADATTDDPTIRRVMGFAKAWGFGGLVMVNLFAYRATDPRELWKAKDPIGPDNDHWIAHWAKQVQQIVAVWGNGGAFCGRDAVVKALCGRMSAIKLNRSGQPAHPLYLRADLEPVAWIE